MVFRQTDITSEDMEIRTLNVIGGVEVDIKKLETLALLVTAQTVLPTILSVILAQLDKRL